jgi:hypothetical protein
MSANTTVGGRNPFLYAVKSNDLVPVTPGRLNLGSAFSPYNTIYVQNIVGAGGGGGGATGPAGPAGQVLLVLKDLLMLLALKDLLVLLALKDLLV